MSINRYNSGDFNSGTYIPNISDISNITLGYTTLVDTSTAHNLQIGNQVLFLIPQEFGTRQLNNKKGYVISVSSTTSFIVNIDSQNFDSFTTPPTVINPAQVAPVGDNNFNQFFPNNNTKIPRTIQGAFVNQYP